MSFADGRVVRMAGLDRTLSIITVDSVRRPGSTALLLPQVWAVVTLTLACSASQVPVGDAGTVASDAGTIVMVR